MQRQNFMSLDLMFAQILWYFNELACMTPWEVRHYTITIIIPRSIALHLTNINGN